MNSESYFRRRVAEYEFDGENRLLEVRQITEADGSVETEHAEDGVPDYGVTMGRKALQWQLFTEGRTACATLTR